MIAVHQLLCICVNCRARTLVEGSPAARCPRCGDYSVLYDLADVIEDDRDVVTVRLTADGYRAIEEDE